MYSYLYSFIQKLILKKSLNSDAASLLKLLKVKNVIDIGCGDSDVLNYYKFGKNQKYYGPYGCPNQLYAVLYVRQGSLP